MYESRQTSGHSNSDVSWRTFQQLGHRAPRAGLMRYKEVIRSASWRGPLELCSVCVCTCIYSGHTVLKGRATVQLLWLLPREVRVQFQTTSVFPRHSLFLHCSTFVCHNLVSYLEFRFWRSACQEV